MTNSPGSPISIKPSATDLNLTLEQVAGVYAGCAVLDSNDNLIEIHIVATTARKPKQIVRDIETLLKVKHNVKVDYRKISLVQIPDENLLHIPVARPEIQNVTEDNLGNQRRIRVGISGAGKLVTGEATEKIENPMTFQASAKATVNAVQKLVGKYLDVRFEEATTLRIGTREIVLVLLTCLFDNREETFVGASFVGSRPSESAARATLDALNRRIHNLIAQSPRQSEELDVEI